MTRKERMETLGHPATRFTNIYVKNFGEANLSEEEFSQVGILHIFIHLYYTLLYTYTFTRSCM